MEDVIVRAAGLSKSYRTGGVIAPVLRDIDLAVEDAFAFDGARCDRVVAGVFDRIELEAPG